MDGLITLLVFTINLPVLAAMEQVISPINREKGYLFDNFPGYKLHSSQYQGFVTIFILSEGCNITENYYGVCIIKVNNGEDHCPNMRGHNVVVLDKFGVYQDKRVFDTHGDKNAGVNMRNYLNNLPNERIVLISIMDSGDVYVGHAAAALRSVGAVNPTVVDYRTPWLLVGYKGGSPSWITEKSADQYKGPIQANVTIAVPVT